MKVSTFCGCCSLRTGTIIAGSLDLVAEVSSLISMAKYIAYDDSVCKEEEVACGVGKAVLVGMLMLFIISTIIALMLLAGALHKKPALMFPTICVNFGYWIGFIPAAAGYGTFLKHSSVLPGRIITLIWFVIAALFVLAFYLWLVVYSYYKQLVTERLERNVELRYRRHDVISSSDQV